MENSTDYMESNIIKKPAFQLGSKVKEWLPFGICQICMFLFLYTAFSKTIDHQHFLNGLTRFNVFGGLAIYISWLVPAAEFVVSALLIIPKTAKWGLYGFTALLIIFTLYIISVLIWAKNHLPCRCGGAIEKLSWSQHIWFNLAFIAIAIIALRLIKLNSSFKNEKNEKF